MRKILFGLVAGVLVVAGLGPAPAGAESRQRFIWGRGTRAPSFVTGIKEAARSGSAVDAARAHLRANSGRYRIDRPDVDLRVLSSLLDDTLSAVRFRQFHRGIEVFGAHYIVHLDRTEEGWATTAVNGDYFTDLAVSTKPAFGEGAARELAVARSRPTLVDETESHGLTVLPSGNGVLAYHFTLWGRRFNTPVKQEVFVNAHSGAITLSYNNLQADGPLIGSGHLSHGATVPLNIYQRTTAQGVRYELRDQARPMFAMGGEITTHNGNGRDFYLGHDANIATSTSTEFNTNATAIGAVDAHYNVGKVYEYYLSLGRNSIDDEGMSIVSTVNVTEFGQPMYNAFWDGTQMVFGNPNPAELHPFSAALDVVGHELTHGVTQYTGNLVYLDQAGAMNEAYSDYFGEAIDVEVNHNGNMNKPEAGQIGESLCKVPNPANWECPLRDIEDPASLGDPGTTQDYVFYLADFDSGGVHLNSTIYSAALWDIRQQLGGTKGDLIVYEALSKYVTPLQDFVDGRNSVVAAAKGLCACQTNNDIATINRIFDERGIVPGWDTGFVSEGNILIEDVAPVGFFFSPPQVSSGRYIIGHYADKEDMCCKPLQLYVGRTDGSGGLTKVGEDANPSTYNDEMPDLSGNRAVWAHMTLTGGGFDFDVHSRIVGEKVVTIADASNFQWFPSVSGRLVAWEDQRSGQTDVWARYVGKKARRLSGVGEQWMPQAKGDWVAWWDVGNPSSPLSIPKIVMKNLATNKKVTIASKVSGGLVGPPGFGPKHVYWFEDTDLDGIGAIKRARLGRTRAQTVVAESSNLAPVWIGVTNPPVVSANGTYATYSDEYGYALQFSGGSVPADRVGRDVWIVRVSGGTPVLVTQNRGDQAYPSMVGSGRKVLWLDSSPGRTDLLTRKAPI